MSWQDSEIAYFLILASLIENLFQPLVAGNENCAGKYRFLKFNYPQMITRKQVKTGTVPGKTPVLELISDYGQKQN